MSKGERSRANASIPIHRDMEAILGGIAEVAVGHTREALARRYARLQRSLFLSELALAAAFLLSLIWSGVSLRFRDAIGLPFAASATLLFTILTAGYSVLSFPLGYYRSLALPRRYGLSQETFKVWFGTKSKEALLGWLLGTAATIAIYLLISALPEWWWLAAAVLTALVSAALSFLAPWVILPLFFKSEPLAQGELRQGLESMAAKAGFEPAGIFSIDWSRRGTTANAMFLGMGHSRRIVLTDTLLKNYSPEEIEAILAHELGHYRRRHVLRLLVFQSGIVLGLFLLTHFALKPLTAPGGPFGLQGPSDLAGLPLLLIILMVFGLALSPALMAFSRHVESQADTFALNLTGNPAAFSQALSRLHDQNLAEANPSRLVEWLFYDHPPLAIRLERARRFQVSHLGRGNS